MAAMAAVGKNEDDESIKVVVRVRKLLSREADQNKVFKVTKSAEIMNENTKKTWTFDKVYSENCSTTSIYFDSISSLVESVVSGFNATIFAYGQTSSGKTYTMMGTDEEPGINKQAVEQLFLAVEDTPERCFLMQVSYMEIYNEQVVDLLGKPGDRASSNLKIRENEAGEVYVDGAKTIPVNSAQEVFSIMEQGERNRHYAGTKMNDRSSRSHTIFRIQLESMNNDGDIEDEEEIDKVEEEEKEEGHGKHVMMSILNLVDLAGSERADQTGAEGSRLREGSSINKSLSMLGQVIMKLSSGDKNAFINYRDSKLTRLLQTSLGGNAKTAIIATITPAQMSEDQSISTLRFASQAKMIKTHAKVNECLDDQAQINRLKAQMAELLAQLEGMKNLQVQGNVAADLQEQLEKERKEKEEQIAKVRSLEQKILVSSIPYKPSKKSMMQFKFGDKDRRMTWAAPKMRASFGGFLSNASKQAAALALPPAPLPPPPAPPVQASESNLPKPSLQRLGSIEEENEPEESKVNMRKRRTVMFKSPEPPQFMAPPHLDSSTILDISMDNGTPKALIRDKYKRVSIRLSQREEELSQREHELQLRKQEIKQLEMEYKELEEFGRLEQEAGVAETRRSSSLSSEDMDKLKILERNFADAEALNLELNKSLHETKQELERVNCLYLEVKGNYEELRASEADLRKRWETLEAESKVQVEALKKLMEKCTNLEGQKQDFDMKLELSLDRKQKEISQLRSALECAYSEISTLEKCDPSSVKARVNKTVELEKQVEQLQKQLEEQQQLVAATAEQQNNLGVDPDKMEKLENDLAQQVEMVENMKMKIHELTAAHEKIEKQNNEIAHLKEGFEALSNELDCLAKDKCKLEDDLRAAQVNEGQGHSDALQQEKNALMETVNQLSSDKKSLSEENKNLKSTKGEFEMLKESLEPLHEQIAELQQAKENAEALIESRKTEEVKALDEVKKELIKAEAVIAEKETDKQALLDQIKSIEDSNKEFQENALKLEKEKNELKTAQDKLSKEVEDLKSFQGTNDYNRLRAQFDQQLLDKEKELTDIQEVLEQQHLKHSEEITKMKTQSLNSTLPSESMDNLKIELDKVNNLNLQLNSQVEELKEVIKNSNNDGHDLIALKDEVEKLKSENVTLKKSAKNVFNNTGHGNNQDKEELSSLTLELNRLRTEQEKLCNVQDENVELKNKLVNIQNNYENVKLSNDKLKTYQKENDELKEIMDRMNADIESMRDASVKGEELETENKALKRKIDHLTDVNRELEKLKSRSGQLVEIEKENHEMRDCLRKLEEDLSQLKTENADLKEQNENISKLTSEVSEKEQRFALVQAEMDSLKASAKKATELSQENADLKEAYETIASDLEKLKSELETFEDNNRELKQKADDATKIREQLKLVETQNSELKTNLDGQMSANMNLQQQITDLESRTAELETEVRNESEKAESSEAELTILREANAHLQERITDMKKTANASDESVNAELEQLRGKLRQLADLEAAYNAKEEKLTEVQEELDCLKSSVDELSELQDEYQLLKSKEQEFAKAQEEIVNLQKSHEKYLSLQEEYDSLRSKGVELAERLKTRNEELAEAQTEIVRLQQIEEAYNRNQEDLNKTASNVDFNEMLKAKEEEIVEIQEELNAWRFKSKEIMSLLSGKDNVIDTEPKLLARIQLLRSYEDQCTNQVNNTKTTDNEQMINLERELEEYKIMALEQKEMLHRLQNQNKYQEESNDTLNHEVSGIKEEIQQLKTTVNESCIEKSFVAKSTKSIADISCYDMDGTMDFTIGALKANFTAPLNQTGCGSDLMSELAAANQKSKSLKEATLLQLNATLGNLDDTLRLCMDLSMLPPPPPSTKGGSTSSAGSELDESCTAAHSPPSAAANTTVAAANETFSGKMMIDINEILEMKNQLELLQTQLINFDIEEFNRNKVELMVLKQENEALSKKITDPSTTNEIEFLKSQLSEANAIIEKLKVALSSNTQIPDLEEEIVRKDEEILSLHDKLKSVSQYLQDKDSSAASNFVTLQGKFISNEKKLDHLHNVSLDEKDDIQLKLVELKDANNVLKTNLEVMQNEKKEVEANLEAMLKTIDILQEKLNDNTSAKSEESSDLEEMSAALSAVTEENNQLRSKLSAACDEKEKLSIKSKSLEEACGELAEIKNSLVSLVDVNSNLESKNKELQSENQDLIEDNNNVKQILSKLEEDFSSTKANAEVLRNTLTDITEQVDNFKKLVGDISQEKDQYESSLETVAKEKDAISEKNNRLEDRISTLETELKNSMSNDSSNNKELDLIKSKYVDLQEDHDHVRQMVCELTEENDTLKTKLDDMKNKSDSNDSLSALLHDKQEENKNLKETLADLEYQLDSLRKTQSELPTIDTSDELEKTKAKLADLNADNEELRFLINKMVTENEELKNKISQSESSIVDTSNNDELEKTKAKLVDLKEDNEELRFLINKMVTENEELKEQSIAAASKSIHPVVEDLEISKAKIVDLNEDNESLRTLIRELSEENESLRECLKDSSDKAEFSKLRRQITNLKDENEELKEKLNSNETDENHINKDELEQQLKETTDENNCLKEKIEEYKELLSTKEREQAILRSATKESVSNNLSALEEQLKTEDLTKRAEEIEKLRSEYEDRIAELESQLATALRGASSPRDLDTNPDEKSAAQIKALVDEKKQLETKLREREWELSGIKVDLHKGEINFQKAKKRLQDELEYEKERVNKLNTRIRHLESDRMEDSFKAPANPVSRVARSSVSRSTNTSTADCASPEWGSGSGLIKEVRLYELEHKTVRLEKEMKKEKEATEFYRKRGNDWKSHAKWYEEVLDHHKIRYRKPYADKENQKPSDASQENVATAASSKPKPLGARTDSDRVLGELETGLGNLGLGKQTADEVRLQKMKEKAQEVLGVKSKTERDPVILEKERPPNDCPTQ